MEEKKECVYKREYSFYDATRGFLYSLLVPLCVMFLGSIIGLIIVKLCGVNLENVSQNPIYIIFVSLLGNIALFVFFIYFTRSNNVYLFRATRYKKSLDYKVIIILFVMAIISVVGSLSFVNYFEYLFERLNYKPNTQVQLPLTNIWWYFLNLFLSAVLPAIVEEFVYRGVIFNGLRTKLRPYAAILLGAFFFMIMHGSLQQTIYQFVLGIILCFIMYITDNLCYCIIFHFFNNFIVITLTYINKMTGFEFPFDFSNLWIVVGAFMMFIFCGVLIAIAIKILSKLCEREQSETIPQGAKSITKQEWIVLVVGLVIAITYWCCGSFIRGV